jgi:hypothetical protein
MAVRVYANIDVVTAFGDTDVRQLLAGLRPSSSAVAISMTELPLGLLGDL